MSYKPASHASNSAFTLIELLIVVAIIAILAAIAVPNFLEAQVRAKVSRTRNDMRSVAVAIEAYAVDNNTKYPVPQFTGAGGFNWNLPPGLSGPGYMAYGMTTPIGYLSSIPLDPFGREHELPGEMAGTTYHYFYSNMDFHHNTVLKATYYPWRVSYFCDNPLDIQNNTNKGYNYPLWELQSRGPDQYMKHFVNELDVPQFFAYDPTNGTVSAGNILRVGP